MSEDNDRAAILSRRARYVAIALTGTTVSTMATACVCLSVVVRVDGGAIDGGGADGGPDAMSRYPRDSGQDVTATQDAPASEDAATDDAVATQDAASDEDAAVQDAAFQDAAVRVAPGPGRP